MNHVRIGPTYRVKLGQSTLVGKFELVPGLYSNAQGYRTVSTQDGEQYFTCADGSWVKSTGVKGTETYNAVRLLGTWKREITF